MEDRNTEKLAVPRHRSTIADVAALAGVGLSTVSRVIRNAPSVSEETRRKVEDAVAATGYQVDSVARSLRNSGSLNLVALIVPDVADPYFADVYTNLQRSALERGDSLLLGSHAESHRTQTELLRQMTLYRPSVVVLVPAPGTSSEEVADLKDQGVQVVLLDRPVPGASADSVLPENEVGAELLVSSFVERGCERVGVVSLPRTIWTQDRRFKAVTDAFARHGIAPVIAMEEAALTAPTGDAFGPLFAEGVDAVIALSVPPAMGVMRREQNDGYEPLSIGCFDRHPWFDLVSREIISVSQDTGAVADSVDFHIERRRNDPLAVPLTSVLPFRLDGTVPALAVRARH